MKRIALPFALAPVFIWAAIGTYAQSPDALLNSGRYSEAREAYADSLRGTAIEGYFETYLLKGALDDGLRRVQRMLDQTPENPYVHYAAGRLHIARGAWPEAEAAYTRAIQYKNDYWRAGLELGDLYRLKGNERQARRLFQTINARLRQGGFTNAADLATGAHAAMRLELYHDANEALTTALRLEPSNAQLLIWHGDLYAATYDEAYAQERYEKALEINPKRADAYVKLANVSSGYAGKETLAQEALKVIPSYAPALSLMANLHLLDGDYPGAKDLLSEALESDPGLIEGWARLGAAYHLMGDSVAFAQVESRVHALTQQTSAFYRVISEDLALRFRYPAATHMAQRAVDADPTNAAANATLGVALLRQGQLETAQLYLNRSYDRDAFNLFAANTLSLLDALNGFVILESNHFRLRIHPDEGSVLGPAMLREAEAAYRALGTRYPHTLQDKILLEAYHDADDFAVRVAGVPHIGLLGVCFGDVVALNTPSAQTGTSYNWARTLWHELAHTMAIGVSRFHVPRWLTEGLSVYEEQRAQPAWRRDLELQFFTALDQGRLHKLEEIDRGFTRPAYPGQVMMSYYHAYRVVDFVVDEYGFDAVIKLLQALGRGLAEEDAFQAALQTTPRNVDQAFRRHLNASRKNLEPVLRGWPDMLTEELHGGSLRSFLASRGEESFYDLLIDGETALEQKDFAAAEEHFKAALALYDDYTGVSNPYEGLLAVYRATGDTDALIATLRAYLDTYAFGAVESRELAELLLNRGDAAQAITYLERSRMVAPYDADVLERLASLYTESGRYRDEVEMRRAILALAPANRAEAYYALARSLYQNSETGEAKRAVLQSLEIAPGFRDAQRLLLTLIDAEQ